jgi:hypothetical protein
MLSPNGHRVHKVSRVGADRFDVKAAAECGVEQVQGPSALIEEFTASLMEKLAPGGGRSRGVGWALCEKHRDFITSRLKSGLRLTKIRKLLRRQEVFVSYATLHRYAVQELAFSAHAPTLPVVDGEPGQELQFDTGLDRVTNLPTQSRSGSSSWSSGSKERELDK